MEPINLLQRQVTNEASSVLRRLGLDPVASDFTGIDPLLRDSASAFFQPFLNAYQAESKASAEDQEFLQRQLVETVFEKLGSVLEQPDNFAPALAKKMTSNLSARRLRRYLRAARSILLGSAPADAQGSEEEALRKKRRYVSLHVAVVQNSNPRDLRAIEDVSALALIVQALQETVVDIPLIVYQGSENVTRTIEKVLYELLRDIEDLRTLYGLKVRTKEGSKDIPILSAAVCSLCRNIGIADEFVWLPVKSLITAPLANQDELLFYSREDAQAKNLANQIVKSDGVILVTGYRGVGKSTFINRVLSTLGEAQEIQGDETRWRIIPVQMNVAKAASVGGALRLCIRAMYRTFRQLRDSEEQEYSQRRMKGELPRREHLLSREEMENLWFANLRASYKVSISQAEAMSKSRSLQTELGFHPGDLFVGPLKSAVMGVLPSVGYKTSKDWNEKMDRTISLLDYDEDRAEEDIVQFISLLTRPRSYHGERVAVKLVFIFDEMDKMEAKEGQDALIRSLKNLFLTRHAVFLLVTSKEFYYMLLEDRKKEDSILGSYFSAIVTVPMFSSVNTLTLLNNLMAVSSTPPSGREQAFLSSLARYLTYRAHGLPREIMREVRSMQQWSPHILQPFLTDRSLQQRSMQLYAQIQDVIENLDSRPTTGKKEASSPVVRERIWLDEGRQEQIRRGMYIQVEELLNRGSFTLDLSQKFSSYDLNFSLVSYGDFCDIFDQVARHLALIKLPIKPNEADTLFFERELSEVDSLSLQPTMAQPMPGKQITIRVLQSFYDVTGRQITQSDSAAAEYAATALTPEQVIEQFLVLLQPKSSFLTRRALSSLNQHPEVTSNSQIQEKLYDLFVSPDQEFLFRMDAGKYLSSKTFYQNVEKDSPAVLLAEETNESILKQLLDLTVNGARSEKRRNLAMQMLRTLIQRNFDGNNPLPGSVFQNALTEIEKFITGKEDAETILRQALRTPDLSSSFINEIDPFYLGGSPSPTRYGPLSWRDSLIAPSLVPVLQNLAQKAGINLLVPLLEHGRYSLEPEALQSIMDTSLADREVIALWKKAVAGNETAIRTDIMIASLPRLRSMLPKTESLLLSWLESEDWDSDYDEEILVGAAQIDYRLLPKLKAAFPRESSPTASERVAEAAYLLSTESKSDMARSADQGSAGDYFNPTWLNLLLGGAMLALFIFGPFDMIPNPTWLDLLKGRGLLLLSGGLLLVALLLFWIAEGEWALILGGVVSLGLSALSYWYLARLGFPHTLWGGIIQFVILAGIFVVPFLFEMLIGELVYRRNLAKERILEAPAK